MARPAKAVVPRGNDFFAGIFFRLLQLYGVKGATKMKKTLLWLINPPTDGPKSTLLLRLMAGGVFFWEGLLKFVYVNQGLAVSQNWASRFRTSRRLSSGTSRSLDGRCCLPA